jgi:NAD(P)H dehydrogenase (quinone)
VTDALDLADLAVTGSTGGLGGMVARQLAAAGSAQRLLVRDAGRAPELENARAVVCNYADSAAARQPWRG